MIQRIVQTQWSIGFVVLLLVVGAMPVQAEESSEPKSIRKTCGQCPDGYATTGVTELVAQMATDAPSTAS